jgi:hypothetical protein
MKEVNFQDWLQTIRIPAADENHKLCGTGQLLHPIYAGLRMSGLSGYITGMW